MYEKVLSAALFLTAVPALGMSYNVVALPDVGGEGFSQALGINDAGDIVGYSQAANGPEAVEWVRRGTPKILQDAAGEGSVAVAINNPGYAVGYSIIGGGSGTEAVKWTPDGTATVLENIPGYVYNGTNLYSAAAINGAGYIVGDSTDSGGYAHPVEWARNGSITALQELGAPGGFANAINAAGFIAGELFTSTGGEAVVWSPDGNPTVLQAVPGYDLTVATGINDANFVVGYAVSSVSGDQIPVEWAHDGALSFLQDVAGLKSSVPFDINNAGNIVGRSGTNGILDAVVWAENGTGVALPEGTYAFAINSAGDIVGDNYPHDHLSTALLWLPRP